MSRYRTNEVSKRQCEYWTAVVQTRVVILSQRYTDDTFFSLLWTVKDLWKPRDNIQKRSRWLLNSNISTFWDSNRKWEFVGYHGKTFAAVWDVHVSVLVCQNAAKRLHRLNISLRACEPDFDWTILKTKSVLDSWATSTNSQDNLTATAETLFESGLVDGLLQKHSGEGQSHRAFKVYGDAPNFNKRKRR